METIKVESRANTGTRESRKLRKAGKIPATLYGHKEDAVSLTINTQDIETAIKHGDRLLEIELDGNKEHALITVIQYDTYGIEVLHADLTRVDIDETVVIEIDVKLVGTPAGVKAGGVLQQTASKVKIEVSVARIPEEFKVIVSGVPLDGTLTIGDIELPEGAKLVDAPDKQLCIVAEIAEAVESEEGDEPVSLEPEVIGAKKDDDETEG